MIAMVAEQYLYKKEVDWSMLNYGINIPLSLQSIFYDSINFIIEKGDSKKIKLIVNGEEYFATITNILFDAKKYPTHKDLLQIRYTHKSEVANKLRSVFSYSFDYLTSEKVKLVNSKSPLSTPLEKREYLVIYSTEFKNTFLCDCFVTQEIEVAKKALSHYGEMEIEAILNSQDLFAEIIEKSRLVKIRKLDKTICDRLKIVYEYRCQVCGEHIGTKYDANVIHSHHIEPFSISMNNNPSNIMIVCPNHHGIIHAVNPFFDRINKSFNYENGYIEKIALNVHL